MSLFVMLYGCGDHVAIFLKASIVGPVCHSNYSEPL